jgi:hypothetical protein
MFVFIVKKYILKNLIFFKLFFYIFESFRYVNVKNKIYIYNILIYF